MTQGHQTFPLCSLCLSSLSPCPELCPQCAHPDCVTAQQEGPICLRPWVENHAIHSFSARYLLNKKSFSVLKKWKINRGLFFDRKILKTNDTLLSTWKKFEAQAIVPIPQSFRRAWRMKGSPALRIAQWISQSLNIPVLPLLKNDSHMGQRQAELNQMERFQHGIKFSTDLTSFNLTSLKLTLSKTTQIERVILVDDFMTTGRTLQQAAIALQNSNIHMIHGFCLGIRMSSNRQSLNLKPQSNDQN